MSFFVAVVIGVILFVTNVPRWISKLHGKLKFYLGYGVPIVLLIFEIPFCFYSIYLCNGSGWETLCNLMATFYNLVIILTAVLFLIIFNCIIKNKKYTFYLVIGILLLMVPVYFLWRL